MQAISERGSYSEVVVRQCFAQLLSGVTHMHMHGVAHRDIKLENLLLEKAGDITQIRIVDFGLAKGHVGVSPLEMKTVCGTPYYVAPEVIAVRGSSFRVLARAPAALGQPDRLASGLLVPSPQECISGVLGVARLERTTISWGCTPSRENGYQA
jgi:serine/threonine protein kinase